MTDFAQYYLTCADTKEADIIVERLLDARLIACAKQVPVSASYWWEQKKETANEVLLVMESRIDLYEDIESLVAENHSYKTFVLECVPLARVNKSAADWLNSNLRVTKNEK